VERKYRVGVVGFGMAGGLSAYLLARDGHQVTLLEQAETLAAYGAGILLQPSGQLILKKLGVLEQVTHRAAPLDELYARHVDGRELIRTRYAEWEPGAKTYGVHRGVFFNAILALVSTQPIEVRLGCEIVAREVQTEGVYLRDALGTRHGPFDFVLCGDGARSQLRQALGFQAYVWRYRHGTLWLVTPGNTLVGQLLQVVQGSRKLFGLLPLGDGLCTLYWGLPVREFEGLRKRGLAALKAEILQFAPEAAEALDFLHDFDQLLLTTYQHVWMPRWYDRHTLFLGDSAHAMSPHLGQGINLAMLDAWIFAECLRSASSPLAAFRAFRAARRTQLRYYALVTFFLSPFFQSDFALLAWGRDIALPLLPRVPFVKRHMLHTVSGLKHDFLAGRMPVP
jgi:2-polyprenyl-6-methoxyphenol hydroxylase-like FAD-dependent oxidoreductase